MPLSLSLLRKLRSSVVLNIPSLQPQAYNNCDCNIFFIQLIKKHLPSNNGRIILVQPLPVSDVDFLIAEIKQNTLGTEIERLKHESEGRLDKDGEKHFKVKTTQQIQQKMLNEIHPVITWQLGNNNHVAIRRVPSTMRLK